MVYIIITSQHNIIHEQSDHNNNAEINEYHSTLTDHVLRHTARVYVLATSACWHNIKLIMVYLLSGIWPGRSLHGNLLHVLCNVK